MIQYMGDTVSIKAVYTKEANADAERQIKSNSYILNMTGESMRNMSKDFLLTQYMLTQSNEQHQLTADCNKEKLKYAV